MIEAKDVLPLALDLVSPRKIYENAIFFWNVSYFKFYQRKKFRLSFSGLIRIQASNGKYLLVESKKVKGKFQLPGGVHRYYDSWVDPEILQEDSALNNIPKFDMRFSVKPGQEYKIRKVLSKFEQGKDREKDPRREYFEELVNTKILPNEKFGDPVFVHKDTISTDFELTNGKSSEYCSTYRYELFDLKLNTEQQKYIDELSRKSSSKYIFASKHELESGITGSDGKKITFPDYLLKLI